jgi:oligoribonuclease (3'-5' exoribonuclease)
VRRDVVVAQHYAHMAELDVMAELATRGHDVGLAERVEATRRQATQTFFFTLQALRRHILKHQAEVGP